MKLGLAKFWVLSLIIFFSCTKNSDLEQALSFFETVEEAQDYSMSFDGVDNNIEIQENEDSFQSKVWDQLYELSTETFVEETDRLKENAAGAGLADND